jgi:glutaredoxin
MKWVIYKKEGCGYCKKAMELFKEHKIKPIVHDMTDQNKEEIYKKIDHKTNSYRYFPIIFRNGVFVGGFTDLEKILTKGPDRTSNSTKMYKEVLHILVKLHNAGENACVIPSPETTVTDASFVRLIKGKPRFPKNFWKDVAETKCRFVIIPCKGIKGFVLYDSKNRNVEWVSCEASNTNIGKSIINAFKSKDVCDDGWLASFGDFGNKMCPMASAWYVYIRVLNPDVGRDKIYNTISSHHSEMKNYILEWHQ